MIKHTADLSPAFFTRLKEICARNGWNPEHLLQVMASESGISSKAHNDNPKTKKDPKTGKIVEVPKEKRYNAVGLTQLMPFVLKNLGYEPNEEDKDLPNYEAFKKLSAEDQLPWVEKFFVPVKRYGLTSAVRFYQANFLPATLGRGSSDDTVIVDDDDDGEKYLGWAYTPNAGFDTNKDRKITVGELGKAVARAANSARYKEALLRLRGAEVGDVAEDPAPDLSAAITTRSQVQAALAKLKYYEGKIDNIWGPKSSAALVAFQKDQKLVQDGIYGKRSRAALEKAVQGG